LDFRDELAVEAQLRAWHNRSVTHNAFGVAQGYLTTQINEHIVVDPGIAYDCFGRELILTRQTSVEIPPAPQKMTLLVRYKYTDEFPDKSESTGVCFCGESLLFAEQPVLFWQETSTVRVQDGVPLVNLSDETAGVVVREKVWARPLARPRLANDTTIAGSTPWQVWILPGMRLPIGLQVTIDTSNAGFAETPCYFAWLNNTPAQLTAENLLLFFLFFWRIEYVMDVKQGQFTFRLLLPMLTLFGGNDVILDKVATRAAPFVFGIPQAVATPRRGGRGNLRAARATAVNPGGLFGARLLAFAQAQQLTVGWLGIQSPGKE
jgi:hypothetical protein